MADSNRDIFDNYLQQIKYIEEYRKRLKCGRCKGLLTGATCIYCNKNIEDKDTIEVIDIINRQLTMIISNFPANVDVNETLNYLYLLRDFSCVSAYIDKIGYSEKLKNEKKFLYDKMFNLEKLNEKELKNLEFMYRNIMTLDDNEKFNFFQIIMKNISLDKNKFSLHLLESVIIDFTFMFLKSRKLYDVTPVIKELSVGVDGLAVIRNSGKKNETKYLKISREVVRMLSNNDFHFIKTIFHEIRHFEQISMWHDIYHPNISAFLDLKDYLISIKCEDYYNSNYLELSFETDAEIFGLDNMIKIIKMIGLPLKNEYFDNIENSRIRHIKNNKNRSRVFEGEELDIEIAFDRFIKDRPELLEQWPYLKYEYTVENGRVRHLYMEEVLEFYDNFNVSRLTSQERLYLNEFFNYISRISPPSLPLAVLTENSQTKKNL